MVQAMGRLVNELTWSRSRDSMFRTCGRKYWYNYYGSWNGWDRDADERTRRIYLLKKLKSRWMWAGTVVHDTIEEALLGLRAGCLPPEEQAQEEALRQLRDDYRSGRAGRWGRKGTTDLFELYYGEELPDEEWRAVRDKVSACLSAFYASPFPSELAGIPRDAWLSVEGMESFDFEGTKVWVVPDVAWRRADGTVCIVDWKTGRWSDEPDPVQLACYALFATLRWEATPDEVLTIEYNLGLAKGHERRIDEARLVDVQQAMRASIAEMKAALRDPARNVADEDAFPRTDDVAECVRCPYKSDCHGPQWRTLGLAKDMELDLARPQS